MGGAYIKYPNIYLANTELWSADCIHLSNVGNERFLNSLQHALENIVLVQSLEKLLAWSAKFK
jgi:hypothetical protein